MELTGNERSVFHARVDGSGRVVIPADLRERHGIAPGEEVVLDEEPHGIRVRSMEEVLAAIQAECRALVPPSTLVCEELLQERRAEAARDAAEEARPHA